MSCVKSNVYAFARRRTCSAAKREAKRKWKNSVKSSYGKSYAKFRKARNKQIQKYGPHKKCVVRVQARPCK